MGGGEENKALSKAGEQRISASRLRLPHADTRIGLKMKDMTIILALLANYNASTLGS